MKKIWKWVLVIASLLIIVAILKFYFYLYNNQNNNLDKINYSVQIVYNLTFIIISLSALLIAYNQLNKTRDATTIQSLTNFANILKSDPFLQKRKELAELILINADDKLNPLNENGLTKFFKNIPKISQRSLSEDEIIKIATLKNKLEVIAYEFEILGYYCKNKIYNLSDIYELFSYELERYWIIFDEIGLIAYLNDEAKGGEKGFYDKYRDLYKKIIKHEVWLENKWTFYWKLKKKIEDKKEEKRKKIGLFLIEESTII